MANILIRPAVKQEILNELEKVLKDKKEAEYCTAMKDLVLLESAIMETLRMTSSSISIRTVEENTTFDSSDGKTYTVQKGSID